MGYKNTLKLLCIISKSYPQISLNRLWCMENFHERKLVMNVIRIFLWVVQKVVLVRPTNNHSLPQFPLCKFDTLSSSGLECLLLICPSLNFIRSSYAHLRLSSQGSFFLVQKRFTIVDF